MDTWDDWFDQERNGTQEAELEVSDEDTKVDDFDESEIVDIVM